MPERETAVLAAPGPERRPGLWRLVREDLRGVFARDPAARNAIEVLATYPGLHAIMAHRVAHLLWRSGWRFAARFLAFLARMLTNLKTIYFNKQEYGKALSIADRLVILHPNAAGEIRDRGLLSFQVKRYTEASADLERYLRLAPQAEDSEVIREHLRTLRQRVVALN